MVWGGPDWEPRRLLWEEGAPGPAESGAVTGGVLLCRSYASLKAMPGRPQCLRELLGSETRLNRVWMN